MTIPVRKPQTKTNPSPASPSPVENDGVEGPLPKGIWLKQQHAHVFLQRLILGAILLLVAVIQGVLAWLVPDYPAWLLPVILTLLVVVFLAGIAYTGAAHRRYGFMLDDLALRIRKGVFWHAETAVPLNRVQHTDITQGPLQRRYGLARLVIHTAGTRHALVNLDGITKNQAHQLRQALSFDHDSGAV